MIVTFKDLKLGNIEARDGELGHVKDVLFDDRSWRARYIVADTSKWLPGRKVLLSPDSFSKEGLNAEGNLVVDLTKEQVKQSPSLDEDLPVSRQYESVLSDYYGWIPYWTQPSAFAGFPYPDMYMPVPPTTVPAEWADIAEQRVRRFDAHLRSCEEIVGYRIRSHDEEKFGEVADMLLETREWVIIDLILASRKWLPGGKEFVCSPMFVTEFNHQNGELDLSLDKEVLLESPDYGLDDYSEGYRRSLVDYYRKRQGDRNAFTSAS